MRRAPIRRRGALALGLATALSGCAAPMERATDADGPTDKTVRRVAVATPAQVSDQRPAALQPTRLPATTMHAWIAPWEDATGDLYPASTVYIEVQAERWQYGGSGVATVLRPMQVEPRSEPSAQPAAALQPAPLPAPGPADAGRRGA